MCSTVRPWAAGDAPEGHNSASSSAASPRCDRPRSSQSGPYAPAAIELRAVTKLVPSAGRS
jgi:hypothetical protein